MRVVDCGKKNRGFPVGFDPTGHTLAAAGNDTGKVGVWDVDI